MCFSVKGTRFLRWYHVTKAKVVSNGNLGVVGAGQKPDTALPNSGPSDAPTKSVLPRHLHAQQEEKYQEWKQHHHMFQKGCHQYPKFYGAFMKHSILKSMNNTFFRGNVR